jgi:hypothetical protein
MSIRSIIAKRIGEDKYRTIYCHSDGYPTYNGALLVDHYSTEELVDRLMELGDLSLLNEKVDPDPMRVHRFEYGKRQPGVTVAYGRDRGEKNTEAKEFTFEELSAPGNWAEFIYVYDFDHTWKYFKSQEAEMGFHDLKEDLKRIYEEFDMERPRGYYGYINEEMAEYLKSKMEPGEEPGSVMSM